MRPLGIIGGVGPYATSLYYCGLIDKVTAASGGQMPELLLYSLPIDSSVEAAFISAHSPVEEAVRAQVRDLMSRALSWFAQRDIDTVAMPCNTLQPLLGELSRDYRIHNVDIVRATSKRVSQLGMTHVLIVGTMTTWRSNVYGVQLEALNVRYRYLPTAEQQLAAQHILQVLRAPYANTPYLPRLLESIVRACREVDGVVVGCTDLANQLTAEIAGVPVIDSLQALIEESATYILSSYPVHS